MFSLSTQGKLVYEQMVGLYSLCKVMVKVVSIIEPKGCAKGCAARILVLSSKHF